MMEVKTTLVEEIDLKSGNSRCNQYHARLIWQVVFNLYRNSGGNLEQMENLLCDYDLFKKYIEESLHSEDPLVIRLGIHTNCGYTTAYSSYREPNLSDGMFLSYGRYFIAVRITYKYGDSILIEKIEFVEEWSKIVSEKNQPYKV